MTMQMHTLRLTTLNIKCSDCQEHRYAKTWYKELSFTG